VLSIGMHDRTHGFIEAFHIAAQLHQEVTDTGFADVRVLGLWGRRGPSSTRPATTPTHGSIELRCAQLDLDNEPHLLVYNVYFTDDGTRMRIERRAGG
jgi:hypothetical protein